MDTVRTTLPETIEIEPVELQQAIEEAAKILKAAGAEAVFLFGSVVEGPFRPNSDIDLAVTGLPPTKFFQTMGQTMSVLPRSIDLVDLDIDTPFTRYLKEKGKLYLLISTGMGQDARFSSVQRRNLAATTERA